MRCDAQASSLVGVRDTGGATLVWLVSPEGQT